MAHASAHHGSEAQAHAVAHEKGQQHPLRVYFVVWGLLFVLSTFSYLVDYFHVQGICDGR